MKGGAVGVRRVACVAKYARRADMQRTRGGVGLRLENWAERTEELGELRVKEREFSTGWEHSTLTAKVVDGSR